MARNPAKKSAKKSAVPKAAKKKPVAAKRAAKHGGKVITAQDILDAEQLNNVPKTIKLPSAKYVHDFVKTTLKNLDSEKDSAVADIRNAHGNAQEQHHVEKRAMSMAVRLHKMPDSKLQETMYHLSHYISALGLWERALKQGQLDLTKAEEADGEEGGEGEGETQTEQSTDEPAAGTDGVKSPGLTLVPPGESEAA